MMMQEIQGVQNRFEGRMQENEKKVAQVIGSEARDALRGQRSKMLHEHQALLQAGEGEKKFVKSHTHLNLQSHSVTSHKKILTRSRSSTRANYTKLGIPGSTLDRLPCFNYKEEIEVMIESVIIGIPPHCNYFKKEKYQVRKNSSFIHSH